MNEHASFLSLKQALARTRKPPTLSAGGLMIDSSSMLRQHRNALSSLVGVGYGVQVSTTDGTHLLAHSLSLSSSAISLKLPARLLTSRFSACLNTRQRLRWGGTSAYFPLDIGPFSE
jgi:hypothetical protein